MTAAEQSGGFSPSKLSDVEKGLSALWGKPIPYGSKESGPPEVRVCTLSLVIYAPDDEAQSFALEAVHRATSENPLRVICMRVEPAGPDVPPEGQVSGMCQVTDTGNVVVCCEEIIVTAKGKAVNELAASVSNLLVSDLPIVLWWMGRPDFDLPLLNQLELISDYILVDSHEFSDTLDGFQRMIDNLEGHPQVIPNDFNWLRTSAWRELTAELFDDPVNLSKLHEITALDIAYSSAGISNPSQALLYAAWFAGRLNWYTAEKLSLSDSNEYSARMKTVDGKDIAITLKQVDRVEPSDGNLVSISIKTSVGDSFVLDYADCRINVEAIAGGKTTSGMCIPWCPKSLSINEMLAKELSALWPDAVYVDTLKTCAKLIEG